MKPSLWDLFQSIDRLIQLTSMSGKVRVSKALWLHHIYFFVKITMKESISHIKLANNPTIGDSKSKDEVDSGGFTMGLKVLV